MTTALQPDELLAEARLPILPAHTRFGFAEFSRRAGDFAMAMALAVLEIKGGVIATPRLGIGGAEAAPRRIEAAEATLRGEKPREAVFRLAAAAAAAAIEPLEDPQTDAQYRRETGRCDGVYRALKQAERINEVLDITLIINGRNYPLRVEPRRALLDAIRDECA